MEVNMRESPQISAAKSLEAQYVYVPAFSWHATVAESAQQFVEQNSHIATLLENGFRTPRNITRLAKQMRSVVKQCGGPFDEAWCAVGSGALIKAMQEANLARYYFGVCVFGECPEIGDATPIIIDTPFNTMTAPDDLPPFPSALRYDAKVWRVLLERAKGEKILFWNVLA